MSTQLKTLVLLCLVIGAAASVATVAAYSPHETAATTVVHPTPQVNDPGIPTPIPPETPREQQLFDQYGPVLPANHPFFTDSFGPQYHNW